ncbi:MAG TPA: isochorismatase family cysteine hydrolase [bacterium]|nr:isochorismatase family cysteine hydrolase [bacterium]
MVEVPAYTIEPRVEVSPEHTALIVVDMQNDFVDPRGSLCVGTARATVPAIARLCTFARAHGLTVVYTQDWHRPDDPEFALWGAHAVAGTWGAEIVPDLAPRPEDLVVRKLRYDAFYGTSLDHELRQRRIAAVIVTGTVSNICVLHTAGSAALRWLQVIVPVDAVSALTEFDQQAALRQIAFLYRGTLTQSENIVAKAG